MALNKELVDQAMRVLFPDTKDENAIDEAAGIIAEYGMTFGIQSHMGVAMFLGQVREEVGSDFVADKKESLNYSSAALPKVFKYFRENPLDAEKYGRNEDHRANQVAIANLVYGNRYGNGAPETNEGNIFRGSGIIQLTFKGNYHAVQRILDDAVPNEKINIMDGMDGTREGVFSALGYWRMNNLAKYSQAFVAGEMDSTEAMNAMTAKINKHTKSYEKRVAHFEKIAPMMA